MFNALIQKPVKNVNLFYLPCWPNGWNYRAVPYHSKHFGPKREAHSHHDSLFLLQMKTEAF